MISFKALNQIRGLDLGNWGADIHTNCRPVYNDIANSLNLRLCNIFLFMSKD